jgi:HD domain-containing protein
MESRCWAAARSNRHSGRRVRSAGMVAGMTLEEWAAGEAERLLSPLGDRWKHVRAVGEHARGIGAILDQEDRTYLVAAAYLHDIGYAPDLQRTGLHQLDGARYVQSFGAERLARLIAHHSEARFEIRLRGFGYELAAYKREESWVSDALTYCDLTTGPAGLPMTFEDRIAEVERRYGEGEIVDALRQATPYLVGAIARTKDRLRQRRSQPRSGDDRLRRLLQVMPDPEAD